MKRTLTLAALALILAFAASPAAAEQIGPASYVTCYHSRYKPVRCTRLPVKPAPRFSYRGGW